MIRKSNLRSKLLVFVDLVASKLSKIGILKSAKPLYQAFRRLVLPSNDCWINFYGYQLLIDPTEHVGKKIFQRKFHEEDLRKFIQSNVQEGDIVLDVGAHIGSVALLFRKNIGDGGEIHCFEPSPPNYENLNQTAERNGFDNFVCLQKAVGETGEFKLKHYYSNTGQSTMRDKPSNNNDFDVFTVESIKLSSYLERFAYVDWIKIDVEGLEYEIISDLEGSLDGVGAIIVEFHKERISSSDLSEIYTLLSSNGELETLEGSREDLEEFLRSGKKDYVWTSN